MKSLVLLWLEGLGVFVEFFAVIGGSVGVLPHLCVDYIYNCCESGRNII